MRIPPFYLYCWIDLQRGASKCSIDIEQNKHTLSDELEHSFEQNLDISDYGFIALFIILTIIGLIGCLGCLWRTIQNRPTLPHHYQEQPPHYDNEDHQPRPAPRYDRPAR